MGEEGVSELTDSITEKIREANISLIINDYDEIFSDFDPRSYIERAISDDFLQECRRAARDKEDGIELRILIPKAKRNMKEEWKIKKRLRDHFNHHLGEKERKMTKIKKEGGIWVTVGILILFGVLLGILKFENTIIGTMLPILEVPCWFLIWEGMGKIFFDSREIEPEHEFYKKMAKSEINFAEY